ncbi:nitrous oxide reductase accessory protein NosL [Cytobacillus sp. Hz8]|uniref:nitrous oxide reductase accessory protein NosL n=1 Tax=Cytobacillus sp. Hz8 TaxID=3347168 RepID=UPI0035DDD0E7
MKKKILFILFGLLSAIILSACSSEKQNNVTENNDKQAKQEESTTTAKAIEPTHNDKCAFCNMKIYTKEDKMGVFTAQAVNKDGKNIFFDDSGCLLNYERKTGEQLKNQWVKDYESSKWIDAKTAVPVKANVQTPMKYGYLFFADKANADKYVSENKNLQAAIVSWNDIDKVANERYKMKMNMSSKDKMNMKSDDQMNMDSKDKK